MNRPRLVTQSYHVTHFIPKAQFSPPEKHKPMTRFEKIQAAVFIFSFLYFAVRLWLRF